MNVRLHLVLKDESPVMGAEVSVKGDKIERTARSDSGGIISVEGLTPGSIEIRVRRIGFKQTQFLARVATSDNAFTITVDGTSVTLDEMRIVGNRSVVGRLEDFDMRTKRGDASAVVTAEQIDSRNPVRLFPKDAYGTEIFNGPSRIPLNMGGMRQDNWCGLIAIWTRSG